VAVKTLRYQFSSSTDSFPSPGLADTVQNFPDEHNFFVSDRASEKYKEVHVVIARDKMAEGGDRYRCVSEESKYVVDYFC
jgi:hypothetical protein